MYRRWHKQSTETSTKIKTKSGYNLYRKWTHTDYQNKQYIINKKWLQHVKGMDTSRLPIKALKYKPKVATTCTNNRQKKNNKRRNTI